MGARIDLADVVWTETSRSWHAVSEKSRWGRALCGTIADGYYAFNVTEYPDGPPVEVRGHYHVCARCAERVEALLAREAGPR